MEFVPVIGVHENPAAGLNFRDPRIVRGKGQRARATRADDFDRDALALEHAPRLCEEFDRLAARGFFLRIVHAHGVAFIAHQAREDHPWRIAGLAGEREGGRARGNATALHAHIDFDEHAHVDPDTRCRIADGLDVNRVIDSHHHVCAPAQVDQAGDFLVSDDLVGDEDIRDTRIGKDLGLSEFGTGDAECSCAQFRVGNGRGFVALGVGPPVQAAVSTPCGHAPDVVFHFVEIDEQGGRVERVDGLTDGRIGHGINRGWGCCRAIRR